MHRKALRTAAGALGILASAGFGYGIVHSALGADQSQQAAMPAAELLPMEQVLANLKQQGYAEITEIERERDRYEVKARNREGQRVELYVDARTGQTMTSERDGDDD